MVSPGLMIDRNVWKYALVDPSANTQRVAGAGSPAAACPAANIVGPPRVYIARSAVIATPFSDTTTAPSSAWSRPGSWFTQIVSREEAGTSYVRDTAAAPWRR